MNGAHHFHSKSNKPSAVRIKASIFVSAWIVPVEVGRSDEKWSIQGQAPWAQATNSSPKMSPYLR